MAYIPVCTRPKTTRLKLDINCFLCTNKLSVLNEAIRHYMRLSSRIFYLLRKFHFLHPHRPLRDPGRHPRDLPRQQIKTSVVTASPTISSTTSTHRLNVIFLFLEIIGAMQHKKAVQNLYLIVETQILLR
jgi:hypothetical protein